MKRTDVEIEILTALRSLERRADKIERLLQGFVFKLDENGAIVQPEDDKARS